MTSDLDFSGKSVLVTGAASGIGAACVAWLAERGAALRQPGNASRADAGGGAGDEDGLAGEIEIGSHAIRD